MNEFEIGDKGGEVFANIRQFLVLDCFVDELVLKLHELISSFVYFFENLFSADINFLYLEHGTHVFAKIGVYH